MISYTHTCSLLPAHNFFNLELLVQSGDEKASKALKHFIFLKQFLVCSFSTNIRNFREKKTQFLDKIDSRKNWFQNHCLPGEARTGADILVGPHYQMRFWLQYQALNKCIEKPVCASQQVHTRLSKCTCVSARQISLRKCLSNCI